MRRRWLDWLGLGEEGLRGPVPEPMFLLGAP